MSDRKGGFDPGKLNGPKRSTPIIPEILSETNESRAHGFTEIRVMGVGGAGGNTINRMIQDGVRGIEFVAVNSDLQALQSSRSRHKIAIGQRLTRGLGTGGDTRLGLKAAEDDTESLKEAVTGADMVFVTAGMGGGTGTGASPYVAQLARAARALTVGIVTRPFRFEGRRRQEIAEDGIEELKQHVDALIVIANEKLLQIAPPTSNLLDAFQIADDVLHQGIAGVADLVITPGLINLDFADISSVMSRSGAALMAIGSASGEDRALKAAEAAMRSPLLEDSITGAHGILLNVTGGPGTTLHDIQTVAETVGQAVSADANIILGASIHPHLEDELRLTLIATGFG